ncbi:MAG: tetratricopeptide repeat protein [Mariprofundus sp.]
MLRFLFITVTLFVLLPCPSMAAGSDRVQAARIFLNNGNPDQAVLSAESILKKRDVNRTEQLDLLSLIADAHIMRATHQHFQQVEPATGAIENLLHEFPDHPQAAEYRWQRAWLWWQTGNEKQAMTSVREIIAKDQQPENLRRAWLLMARIHLKQRHYAYARSDLLQYGLQVTSKSREQATGMAWMAMADLGENRNGPALSTLKTVFKRWPTVISDEPTLYATYIKLRYAHADNTVALALAEDFIRQYINTEQAAEVRLIRADILATDNSSITRALKEYGILADTRAETRIGLQAFMRKMMLENRTEQAREKLTPVMIALKKIADNHQLSPLEDEAMLDLARLWVKILPTTGGSGPHTPALDAYAHAANSTNQHIASTASHEGALWLGRKIQSLLDHEQWLAAITAWRQFPQLQPAAGDAQPLRLSIAHAMRMLMLFDNAEEMLQDLYARNKTSLRGQVVMVELAKLWMDRQQPDGIRKIMHWLNRNPYSIYRPEMLLIVARMQLEQKQVELARQTLAAVRADNLSMESRISYWRIQAEISAATDAWHSAARSWEHYRTSPGSDPVEGLLNQADALLNAGEYSAARKLYKQAPDAKQDTEWQYHLAICQLRSGQAKQGTTLLQRIIDNKDSGRFAALAKLALVDQQAATLLGEKP